MTIPPAVVHCGVGLLATALSIPLVLRRVPRNRVYGVRVAQAFASDRNWYEINSYGGKLLLGYGVFLTAFGYFARNLAPPLSSLWSPVFVVGPLLLVFPLLALIGLRARRLPDR